MLLTMGVALAATEVDVSWNGAGDVNATAGMGDDHVSKFSTSGNLVSGNFHVVNAEDNPYNYGVDTVNSYADAKVGLGGFIEYQIDRTDSKDSTYGPAGQQFYAWAYSSDGEAQMATGARSNYADLVSATYGKDKTDNGHNFEVGGTYFQAMQQITDGAGDGAYFKLEGTGSADIDAMSSVMGGSSFKLAKGAGCYTNADLAASGAGRFTVSSWADNGINVDSGSVVIPGDGNDNSAKYFMQIDYAGDFNYGNFALDGD